MYRTEKSEIPHMCFCFYRGISKRNRQSTEDLKDFFYMGPTSFLWKLFEIHVVLIVELFGKPKPTSTVNPLPDNKILDWSKLKQIADDILKSI